jgi:hypothetical protein
MRNLKKSIAKKAFTGTLPASFKATGDAKKPPHIRVKTYLDPHILGIGSFFHPANLGSCAERRAGSTPAFPTPELNLPRRDYCFENRNHTSRRSTSANRR